MTSTDLVYGIHAVHHALKHAPERVLELWFQMGGSGGQSSKRGTNNKLQEIQALADTLSLSWQEVPRKTLDKMSDNQRHQGVILRQRLARIQDETDLKNLIDSASSPLLFLILDGVQDPHNLGACIRTADAAGVNAVIIPASRGTSLSATARKVASGAADSLPLITVSNLARTLKDIQQAGIWLICTSDQAEDSIHDVDLTGSIGLVMGAEDKGIRRLTREHCDRLIHIPMAGVVESLNVSVATGVCLFEAVRQRSGS